jgi:hypothetical protein
VKKKEYVRGRGMKIGRKMTGMRKQWERKEGRI